MALASGLRSGARRPTRDEMRHPRHQARFPAPRPPLASGRTRPSRASDSYPSLRGRTNGAQDTCSEISPRLQPTPHSPTPGIRTSLPSTNSYCQLSSGSACICAMVIGKGASGTTSAHGAITSCFDGPRLPQRQAGAGSPCRLPHQQHTTRQGIRTANSAGLQGNCISNLARGLLLGRSYRTLEQASRCPASRRPVQAAPGT